ILHFASSGPSRDLHSFPTRRSSDLRNLDHRRVSVQHEATALCKTCEKNRVLTNGGATGMPEVGPLSRAHRRRAARPAGGAMPLSHLSVDPMTSMEHLLVESGDIAVFLSELAVHVAQQLSPQDEPVWCGVSLRRRRRS